HLARRDAKTLMICGCGAQAAPHVEALAPLFALERGLAWDIDEARARDFAAKMQRAHRIPFAAAALSAAPGADIIVTCTTAREPSLTEAHVAPGAFIAAVGADNPAKSEIAPSLMARAKVVADVLDQCAHMGDLRHAITAGVMAPEQTYAELGDVVVGDKPGRQ